MFKQFVGLIRDHSGSMGHLGPDAMRDYNDNIHSLKTESSRAGIETFASVIRCGCGRAGSIEHEIINQAIEYVHPITRYPTDGSSTPLFDSVGQMIDLMQRADKHEPMTTAYLIIATTDGENNRIYSWNAVTLANEIKRLQATDRWTFVFRVPRGYKDSLVRMLGLHPGNIVEWDQTSQGVEISTHAMQQSYGNYYGLRAAGATSTAKFFVDTDTVSTKELKVNLVDISHKVKQLMLYPKNRGTAIKDFVEQVTGEPYIIGNAYYELTKTETLQPQKDMIVWDKKSGHMYQGQSAARQLLNLPQTGHIKVVPRGIADKKVFVQSTSVNRKLFGDTVLIYNK